MEEDGGPTKGMRDDCMRCGGVCGSGTGNTRITVVAPNRWRFRKTNMAEYCTRPGCLREMAADICDRARRREGDGPNTMQIRHKIEVWQRVGMSVGEVRV